MNDMLLREAMTLLRSARDSDDHKLCLLCSFEPLHFKSYLQAFLVERFPDAAPQLTSWGYDQLEVGLQESSHALRVHAFFFQAEDGIRDYKVTGVQTCALPIWIVYGNCSYGGSSAWSARSASAPWPTSRRDTPRIGRTSPVEKGGKL